MILSKCYSRTWPSSVKRSYLRQLIRHHDKCRESIPEAVFWDIREEMKAKEARLETENDDTLDKICEKEPWIDECRVYDT